MADLPEVEPPTNWSLTSWLSYCLPVGFVSSSTKQHGVREISDTSSFLAETSQPGDLHSGVNGASEIQLRLEPNDLSSKSRSNEIEPAFVTTSATSSHRVDGCVFCDVSVEKGFKILYEVSGKDERYAVFKDRSPGSQVHLLAIPKEHLDNIKSLGRSHLPMIREMEKIGRTVLSAVCGVQASSQRLGFHIPPFFSVNHLHMHLLSTPIPFPGNIKYRPWRPSRSKALASPIAEEATGADLSESNSASAAKFLVLQQHSTSRGNDHSYLDTTATSGPTSDRSSSKATEKIKGFSWFVDVQQVCRILEAEKKIKVGAVRIPIVARTTPV